MNVNNFLSIANNTKNGVTRKERIMHTQDENKNYRELAILSLRRHQTREKTNCIKLYRLLKKHFRYIKRARITAEKSENKLAHSRSLQWINDNFYILEEQKNACLSSLKNYGKLTGTFSESGEFKKLHLPRYFVCFYDYFSLCDTSLSKAVLESFVSCADRSSGIRPGFSDLYSFELLFKCAVICKAGALCKELSENPYFANDSGYAEAIEKCITSLRFLNTYSFDKAFEKCQTEEYLRQDPAGFYSDMTKETKDYYRQRVSLLASKRSISETDLVRDCLEKARGAGEEKYKHIGAYLYPEKKSAPGKLYFVMTIITVCVFTVILCTFTPLGVLFIFPVWETVKQIYDKLFAHFTKNVPLPALDLKTIPDTDGVLVVITTLLMGEKADNEIFSRLENMYLSNGMKNIYFAVLGDFPDSEEQTNDTDKVILENAESHISSLNSKYGNNFYLFIRKRKFSNSENKYMGYERKRGAVCTLTRFLCGKNTDDFIKTSVSMPQSMCESIHYIVTLDADTNLPCDAVRELTGKMLHPLNKPVIDKKTDTVVSGYGIMQPRIAPELESALRSRFSQIMCGTGGIDVYTFAQFDLYQSVFGEGVFCGKGIFDKYAFDKTINCEKTAFAPGKVLSHDIIEGARLRTALINNLEVTDSFPSSVLSYLKRHHRWVRGDIQNLIFLAPTFINASGKRVKNNISTLSKFKIADNVRRELVPVISFLGLIFSSALAPVNACFVVLYSIFWIIFPFISDLSAMISTLSVQCAARRFFSKGITSGIYQSFMRMLMNLSMLPTNAITTLDAMLRSAYRIMFSNKKTLEWVTAAQSNSESQSDIWLYVRKALPGAIIGTLMFLFSPYPTVKIIGILWLIFPVVAYTSSKIIKPEINLPTIAEKEIIKKYAFDMWNFFENTVSAQDSFLPPDNLQLYPTRILAHRTSPTNIGLYLLCILCARDFGFIDTEKMYARLENTISSAEKMQKWKGHLYNWYNTRDLSVLNPVYISSVDSGNFLACLISLKEGLKSYVHEKTELAVLINRIEKIISDADIGALYNNERNLFSLGVSVENEEEKINSGCYDLYMSEARTLSFLAVASRKVPKKHWAALSRPLIKHSYRIGLASWTGTAFEYFMPALFLPCIKGSLIYEALMFALFRQKDRRAEIAGKSIWGISESGYFAFDSNMNYRYRAFGIPELGYKTGLENDLVISPYSSFLAMQLNIPSALSNLRKLKKLGAYGKFGFYEAYDFTPERTGSNGALVKSHMSHHVGMSLISCANAYFDNIFVKRFMSDNAMRSAKELLEEKIPVSAEVVKIKHIKGYPERQKTIFRNKNRQQKFLSVEHPFCKIISNGSKGIVISDAGFIKMYSDENTINRSSREFHGVKNGFFSFFEYDGNAYSTSFFPLYREDMKYRMEYSFASASHICSNDKFKAKTSYRILSTSTAIAVKLKISPKKAGVLPNTIKTAFCFEPIITNEKQYYAHPAFSSLFVTCRYDNDNNILIYKRKGRNDPSKALYLAVALSDRNSNFDFSVRKNSVFGTSFNHEKYADIFKLPLDNSDGACISPLCLIRTKLNKSTDYSCTLLMATADTESEAISAIATARSEQFYGSTEKSENEAILLALNTGIFPGNENEKALTEMLTSSIYPRKPQFKETQCSFSRNNLWETGISGDIPIISVIVPSAKSAFLFEKYIKAFMLLAKMNFKIDLALCYTESEKYRRPTEHAIVSAIEKSGAIEYLKKKGGGIFPVNLGVAFDSYESSPRASALFAYSSDVIGIDDHAENITNKFSGEFCIISSPEFMHQSHHPKTALLKSGSGYFNEDYSYTINKLSDTKIMLPQSMVLSGRMLSSVITHNSLGYTFAGNSALKRITPFHNDPCEDMSGERIFLKKNGKLYDLIAMSQTVKYGKGVAVYTGTVRKTPYSIKVYIPEKLHVKVIDISISDPESEIIFAVNAIMGESSADAQKCNVSVLNDRIDFKNPLSEYFSEYTGFVKCMSDDVKYYKCSSGTLSGYSLCISKASGNIRFSLGVYHSYKTLKYILEQLNKKSEELIKSAEKFAQLMLPDTKIISSSAGTELKSTEIMFNFWLPYQNGICRFTARSGFYQSGGAYGFRDQLQDALALMYANSNMAKAHIIRCCNHQFVEGDVLHWWHTKPPKSSEKITEHEFHTGIRSLCSDDYLWLVYAVCEYIRYTGDTEILNIPVRYICGPALSENEKEKYISTQKANEKETVFMHCIRALDLAYRRIGEKGLCLLGTGDWSDGLNKAGENMNGESVWLSMFLKLTTENFARLCKETGRTDMDNYSIKLTKLVQSINKFTFDKNAGYFIRAWYDDGTVIGSNTSEECKIDLLPQAFSVLADIGDEHRQISAINKAYELLYDKDIKILKLLSPAYDKTPKNPGYIKGYVAGIRENGGQYTHAAVWGCMAIIDKGVETKNHELLNKGVSALMWLMPSLRGCDTELYKIYKCEPYVLSADIYSNTDVPGHGGWTWYTGSSGWLWRAILHSVLGIELKNIFLKDKSEIVFKNNAFCVPFYLNGKIQINLPFEHLKAYYKIIYEESESPCITLDGKISSGNIVITQGKHTIKIKGKSLS